MNDPNQKRDLDAENITDPVSFTQDHSDEADRLIEAEELDRMEQEDPKADDRDDIKDR